MILQFVQIGRIAFLKLAVRETLLLCTLVPSLNKVLRDIYAQYVRFVIPSLFTSASPLSLMLSATRVKSPFSQSALFGFIGVTPSPSGQPQVSVGLRSDCPE